MKAQNDHSQNESVHISNQDNHSSINSQENNIPTNTTHIPLSSPVSLPTESFKDAPLQLLPTRLAEISRAAADAYGTYTAIPACTAVVIVGGVIGKGAYLAEQADGSGRVNYPNTMVAILAEPGVGKSSINLVCNPLFKISREYYANWEEEEKPVIEQEIRSLEKALTEFQEKGSISTIKTAQYVESNVDKYKNEQNPSHVSEEEIFLVKKIAAKKHKLKGKRTLIVRDFTSQATIPILAANGGSIIIADADGRDIVKNILGRNSSSGFSDETLFLKGYSYDDIETDRVSTGGNSVPQPCISMIMGIQPQQYQELNSSKKIEDSGFKSRISTVQVPDKYAMEADKRSMPREVEQQWEEQIQNLYDRYRHLPRDERWIVTLSPEAKKISDDYSDEITIKRKEGKGPTANLKELPVRWAQNALRIALIFHIVEQSDNSTESLISADTMNRAIAWQRWLVEAQLRYFYAAAETNYEARRDKVLNLFKNNKKHKTDGVSARELRQNHIEIQSKLAKLLLERMVKEEYLQKVTKRAGNGRSEPVVRYFLPESAYSSS